MRQGGAWSTRPGRGDRQWVSIGGRQVLRGQPRGPGLGRYALRRLADRLHPEWAYPNKRLPNGATPSGVGGSELKCPCDSSLQGRRRGGRPPELLSQPRRAVPGFGSGGPPPGVEGDPARGTEAGNPRSSTGAARCLQLALKTKKKEKNKTKK